MYAYADQSADIQDTAMEKIIHQMWYQGSQNVPPRYSPWRESWKRQNSDCKYMFWDEASICQLLEQSFKDYLVRWQRIDKIIKKCDAARYFILYEFGGVYADLDTFAYKSIDSLIYDLDLSGYSIALSEESHDPQSWKGPIARRIAAERNIDRIVGNAIMISRSKQGFWLEFLDRCFTMCDCPVLESFSTWHLSQFIEGTKHKENIAILPAKYLLATRFQRNSTYAVHRYDATWFDSNKSRPWEG